jgi:anti-sigma factor RsiW
MQCERARELLSPYVDGELPSEEHRNMAAHLDCCGACARLAADYSRIGRMVAEGARESLPGTLLPRVRTALSLAAERERDGAQLLRAGLGGVSWTRALTPLRQVAALVAACLLTALSTWWIVSTSMQRDRLAHEIVSAHIRSLLQERQIDVASSDMHAVKPWFAGRIDFAPEVRAVEGFTLQGGRVDYIDGRRTAVLVYKRRQHTISVFLWPGAADEAIPPRLMAQKGYNLLTWSRGGLIRWAITDLNAEELRQLQNLL